MVIFIVYGVTLLYMGIAAIMACNDASGSRGADDLKVESGDATQDSSTTVQHTPSNGVATNPEGIHVHVHVHNAPCVLNDASQTTSSTVSASQIGQSNGQVK
jgi:hypothetical protein